MSSLINVIDCIIWLRVEWFYQLGVNLGLLGQITGAELCVIYTPNVWDTLSSVPSKR